jgi:hypothetical protein
LPISPFIRLELGLMKLLDCEVLRMDSHQSWRLKHLGLFSVRKFVCKFILDLVWLTQIKHQIHSILEHQSLTIRLELGLTEMKIVDIDHHRWASGQFEISWRYLFTSCLRVSLVGERLLAISLCNLDLNDLCWQYKI